MLSIGKALPFFNHSTLTGTFVFLSKNLTDVLPSIFTSISWSIWFSNIGRAIKNLKNFLKNELKINYFLKKNSHLTVKVDLLELILPASLVSLALYQPASVVLTDLITNEYEFSVSVTSYKSAADVFISFSSLNHLHVGFGFPEPNFIKNLAASFSPIVTLSSLPEIFGGSE